ncbi:MAG: hypothetical protein ACFB01_14790 [Cohaesibacteraceae bacterium]
MAKYKHKGRVTIDRFEKLPEPKKSIDWEVVGGTIVLLFIVAAVLGSCTG